MVVNITFLYTTLSAGNLITQNLYLDKIQILCYNINNKYIYIICGLQHTNY